MEAYPQKDKEAKIRIKCHKIIIQLVILQGKNYKLSHKIAIFKEKIENPPNYNFERKNYKLFLYY